MLIVDDNPYTILGVTKDATDADIKRVYRKLARQYHPDRNPDDAAAEEKFKSIQSAYDKIGTKESRKEYDNRDRMSDIFGNGSPFSGFGGGLWKSTSLKLHLFSLNVCCFALYCIKLFER